MARTTAARRGGRIPRTPAFPLAQGLAAGLASAAGLVPAAAAQKVPDVRLDRTFPGTANSLAVRLAAEGRSVYAVWADSRNGAWDWDIFFNRSLDGGATWLAQDVRLDAGAVPGSGDSWLPSIASDGTYVYVAWQDDRDGGWNTDIFFNRSLDGGTTWLAPDLRVDRAGAAGDARAIHADVAARGLSVWVVWEDDRAGATDIHLNRSVDGGQTWLAQDLRLDTGDAPGASASTNPHIAAAGPGAGATVVVVWEDTRSGATDILCNRSGDGGATWLAAPLRLDTGDPPGSSPSRAPRIALDASGRAVAVWEDDRGGAADIHANRSLDGGATWLAGDVRVDTDPPGAAASVAPRVALSPPDVFAVWEDARSGAGDIYFNRSLDGGATWLAQDVRLDTGDPPGASASSAPQVVALSGAVFVAWADARAGATDVRVNRSPDGGATWLAQDVRLDTGDAPGAHASNTPALAASGNGVHIAWPDGRNSFTNLFDVYANVPLGVQPYGTGKPGSGTIVPQLDSPDLPLLGRTIDLEVTQALGGAAGQLLLGFLPASKIALPVPGGGTLLVAPSVILPLAFGGTPGAPGGGTATLPLALPPNPLLVGLDVHAQVLVLDPGAAAGFSLTAGLDVWIG